MKEYDVHFILKFSDFIGSLESGSKEDARKLAQDIVRSEGFADILATSIIASIKEGDFEVELTDTLEIGTDIF